jgi:hypothetical protein
MNYCDEITTTRQNAYAINVRVRNGETFGPPTEVA